MKDKTVVSKVIINSASRNRQNLLWDFLLNFLIDLFGSLQVLQPGKVI
jgi:hypothetical protein